MTPLTRTVPFLAALALAVFTFAGVACADGGGYVIELTNGETLAANDFSVEDGRLRLVYPVGDAYIPLSSVRSVSREGVKLELLQTEGKYTAKPAGPKREAGEVQAAGKSQASRDIGLIRKRWKSGASEREKPDTGGWKSGGSGWGFRGNEYKQSLPGADGLVDDAEFLSDEELEREFDELFPEFSAYTGLDSP